MDLCEQMNIIVENTAGQSLWSNGLVERHNVVISEMLDKVLADSKCDFDFSLAWCHSAKKSLQNVNDFTPFRRDPILPVSAENELSANSAVDSSDIVRNNLNALHLAHEAYIETENSEDKASIISQCKNF